MKMFMNVIHSEVFYQNDGQEVNLISFSWYFIIIFWCIAGNGLRDTLKNVTDNHCGTL
jgi:hypothetical protein